MTQTQVSTRGDTNQQHEKSEENRKCLLKNYDTPFPRPPDDDLESDLMRCDPIRSKANVVVVVVVDVDPSECLTWTRVQCTLTCDASIKFACSKFPKPCYESVNFEISCRSIIMDGFFGIIAAGDRFGFWTWARATTRSLESGQGFGLVLSVSITAADELQSQWLLLIARLKVSEEAQIPDLQPVSVFVSGGAAVRVSVSLWLVHGSRLK